MRTRLPRIAPGCPYCNEGHDPDIECRWKPESRRFQLSEPTPKPRSEVCATRDNSVKLIAVIHRESRGVAR